MKNVLIILLSNMTEFINLEYKVKCKIKKLVQVWQNLIKKLKT